MRNKAPKLLRGFLIGLYLLVIIGTTIYYLGSDAGSAQSDAGRQVVERTQEQRDAIRMKEYELHIGIYQFYFNLGLSAVTFFYLLTGGILAYFLTNYRQSPKKTLFNVEFRILKLALLLPILLSGVFGWIFIYGANKWVAVIEKVRGFRNYLGIEKVPDMQMMHMLLLVFGYIFFIVGLVLIMLLLLDIDEAPDAVPAQNK